MLECFWVAMIINYPYRKIVFPFWRIIGDTLSNQKIISQISTYLLNYYRLDFASSLKLGTTTKNTIL